jgi:hypothetical protein
MSHSFHGVYGARERYDHFMGVDGVKVFSISRMGREEALLLLLKR